ncbi:MAG: clostripain-related cysteine peptidase [Defluviitaleaceae bacterium]|nr:clostripain-related cysteine peptidase [Defluviitaleaceae bacterium]
MYKKWMILAALIIAGSAAVSFSGFDPFDEYGEIPYTIMIYMNGSDLESEWGAATDDLVEMLDSGLDSRNANVLILTGGALRWMNDAIPETEVIIWQLVDGEINELESMGKVNMGNPDTLRDFISYGLANFPARRHGLIMWDHGGGSIAGFGHDEKFNDASLTLLDMQKAFEESGLRETNLEFLGFDACLMATVEMAVLAADYARVLIAAEDLEPADGWDYNFLSALNRNPHMDGFALGEIIVDTFIDYYGQDSDEILTLSVVDLSRVAPVMDTMGQLMARADILRFSDLAIRRAKTKTFGEGSPRDNYADMVDIGDMAIQLMDLYPREAEAVLHALENCVTYNRHNSDVEIFGLSTFYIYGGKSQGEPSLQTYSDLDMDAHYTDYLHDFFAKLIGRDFAHEHHEYVHTELALWRPLSELAGIFRLEGLLQTETPGDFLWPQLNGRPVALFLITDNGHFRRYAIPVTVNGHEADIIVKFSQNSPRGEVLGIRHQSGNVIQKGHAPIEPSDKIAIYYLERDFNTGRETWHLGEAFTISGPPQLQWSPAPHTHRLGLRHTDICCDTVYTWPKF